MPHPVNLNVIVAVLAPVISPVPLLELQRKVVPVTVSNFASELLVSVSFLLPEFSLPNSGRLDANAGAAETAPSASTAKIGTSAVSAVLPVDLM
jgi:hypothetical protein